MACSAWSRGQAARPKASSALGTRRLALQLRCRQCGRGRGHGCKAEEQAGGGTEGWRPRVVLRKAAFRLLLSTDNQIRCYTPLPGWRYFKGPPVGELREGSAAAPLSWPLATVACDRGSDGVAALHWLQRRERCNVDAAWDASHDAWRDVQRMVREVGLTSWWYRLLDNGMLEATQEIFSHFSATTCELFGEFARHILWEGGRESEIGQQSVLDKLMAGGGRGPDLPREAVQGYDNSVLPCMRGGVGLRPQLD